MLGIVCIFLMIGLLAQAALYHYLTMQRESAWSRERQILQNQVLRSQSLTPIEQFGLAQSIPAEEEIPQRVRFDFAGMGPGLESLQEKVMKKDQELLREEKRGNS